MTRKSAGARIRRKNTKMRLDRTEARYFGLLEAAPDGMVVVNQHEQIILLNLQAERQFGYARDELVGQQVTTIIPEGFAERLVADGLLSAVETLAQQIDTGIELTGRRKDGSTFPIEIMMSPLETDEGLLVTAAIRDITLRRHAENKIRYLNRIYAMLSAINGLIVRVRNHEVLFKEACRIAVDVGGFSAAWIGLVDDSATKINVAASAGIDQAFVPVLNDRYLLDEHAPFGNSMVARAIREKANIVSNDTPADPLALFRNEYPASAAGSIVVLPLVVHDTAIGVLELYSGETDFFDDVEMKLLTEIAGDISFAIDHIDKQERSSYLEYYDGVTGLANRKLFLERVSQYIFSAVHDVHKVALHLIDIDGFKNVNDSFGEEAGDSLLLQVAQWLLNEIGNAHVVARIDRDQFAVVQPMVKHEGDVARLIKRLMEGLQKYSFSMAATTLRISAKVGVAVLPDDATTGDELLKKAEAALKKAKASGDRFVFFTETMTSMVAERLSLETQLRNAYDNEEFVLHYQPKINLLSNKITGVEALIRWNNPKTGPVPPDRFIPILEETGLIHDVGRWALRKTMEDHLRWRASGLPAIRIAVNVSQVQLRSSDFVADIQQVVDIDTDAAAGLELELTESLIMNNVQYNIDMLRTIRAMGVTIAIDDFGTGFSSLSCLAKLPLDKLKIDRMFIHAMSTEPFGQVLVHSIISLAHLLRLQVIAEGVETEEQLSMLKTLGCDEMQGFLHSRPVTSAILEDRYLVPPYID